MGITEQTLKNYGGLNPRQAYVAGSTVKKILKPVRKQKIVAFLWEYYPLSERRAYHSLNFCHSTQRYQRKPDLQLVLRIRIREISATRVRYGYKRIHVLLIREGWKVNHKRVYRIYCEEGLNLRTKQKKKRMAKTKSTAAGHFKGYMMLDHGLCLRFSIQRDAISSPYRPGYLQS